MVASGGEQHRTFAQIQTVKKTSGLNVVFLKVIEAQQLAPS
jgi:hypothetical protein